MPAEIIDITEAVLTAINGHSFPAPYDAFLQAERRYDPSYKLTELREVKVTVATASLAGVLSSRGKMRDMRYEVDIGVQRKLDAPADSVDSKQAIDALMKLVEDIGDFLFDMESLPGLPGVSAIALENQPIYDPERMKIAEFFSVLAVTYQVFR